MSCIEYKIESCKWTSTNANIAELHLTRMYHGLFSYFYQKTENSLINKIKISEVDIYFECNKFLYYYWTYSLLNLRFIES